MVLLLVIAAGLLAVLYGVLQTQALLKAPAGSEKMQEIAAAIQEGAQAYLRRQYMTIGIVGVVVIAILAVFFKSWLQPAGFLIGAVLSGGAGYAGMLISVRANVRTAHAASLSLEKGFPWLSAPAPSPACWWPASPLIGVAGYYGLLTAVLHFKPTDREVIDAMVSLGFGASLISIFARLGGGIFTKGADVGGDLVGKVEAGIPEDDPRNAATIADNVGDNVGDCAGMAADLFETYAVTTVATMVLAAIFFRDADLGTIEQMMMLPLAICGVCIPASIIGSYFVKLGKSRNIMAALYQGLIVCGVLSIIGVGATIWYMVPDPVDIAARMSIGYACSAAASRAWRSPP